MLDTHARGLFFGFNLGRDASVTRATLTVTTDRTTDCDHCQRRKADAVCAEAHQLHRVCRRAHSAVSPDLDIVAQPSFSQSAMRFDDPNLSGQADMFQRMLPRRTRPAVEAGQVIYRLRLWRCRLR